MTTRDRKVLASLLIGSGVMVVVGFVYVFDQLMEFSGVQRTPAGSPVPEHLCEIRVVEDRLGLSKTPFVSYKAGCSTVTDISLGDFHENAGEEMLLIDCERAQVVDLTGRILRTIQFAKPLRFPKMYRIGTGRDDWIAVDEGGWEEINAASAFGKILWGRRAKGTYYHVAAGNLDRDRAPEFVLWTDRTRGLEVVRHDGSALRSIRTDDAVKSVVVLEAGAGDEAGICYTIADRELVLLSTEGAVVARRKPNTPALNYITPVAWPELSSAKLFMQPFSDTLNFATFAGEKVATFISPSLKNQLMWVPLRTAVVRFPQREGSYLVFLTRLYSHPRSVLHIYDRAGALVYHEILEGMNGGLGVALDEGGAATSIFVGGKAGVMRVAQRSYAGPLIAHTTRSKARRNDPRVVDHYRAI